MSKKPKKMGKKRKKSEPRAVGDLGRGKNGQFAEGNRLSVGNKSNTNEKARELKKALFEAVSIEDMKDIAANLVEKAKGGDTPSIKELFDRLLGRPLQTHEIDVEVKTYTMEQRDAIRAMLAGRCVNEA